MEGEAFKPEMFLSANQRSIWPGSGRGSTLPQIESWNHLTGITSLQH